MNQNNATELKFQENTITLLKKMGYTYISREENKSRRGGKLGEVLLKDVLLTQLQCINTFEYKNTEYHFSPKNIARAIDDLDVPTNEGLMKANQKISDKLLLGSSYEEELIDGAKKSFSLLYIDFQNPENNVFHVTEEFSVNRQTLYEGDRTRRPDVVLFVNGIPFAVCELKKSSVSTAEGVAQMIRNQKEKEIPHFFKYIQITLAGNPYSPLYATTGSPKEYYSIWREEEFPEEVMNLVGDRTACELDKMLYSLFSKKRVIEILQSYIIFDANVKKITRHQQYFAIKQTLKKIQTFDSIGRRGGGLIWHTQGSGKSLTMVMLTKLIVKNISDARIIVVTDRKDLDAQIFGTFQKSEIRVGKATSSRDLIEKLRSRMNVITTLIHKFETVEKEKVQIDDANIFVLVDESHRTQGGNLHKAMKKVFIKACYLGFTGTPLLKREKNSIGKFGGLIHKYPIDQAVKDKVVLPLLYESRLVNQKIADSEGLDAEFEIITRHLNDEQKTDLKSKWAKFQRVASSERRLYRIAFDIYEHFVSNIKGTGFNAMFATSSRYEAFKYHKILKGFEGIRSEVVISSPDTREGDNEEETNKGMVAEQWNTYVADYGNEDTYLKKITGEFVYGDDIDLLIVVDKLLTGFDAPRAVVLYVDKELQEHSLLQAIARVNRVYSGKNYGFIIDYRGLLGKLDKALTSYSSFSGFEEEDIHGAVLDLKQEIARVKTYYSHLQDFFAEVKNKQDLESYAVFLDTLEKRTSFYELLSLFGRALRIVLQSYYDTVNSVFTDTEINEYKNAMKFYNELRQNVRRRNSEMIDFGEYEGQMQKLLDVFVGAEDVSQLTKLVNIFEEEFEQELERVVGDNARADTILSATTKVIQEQRERNPAFYDRLSRRIQNIIDEYKAGRLSEEEKLNNAHDVRKLLLQKNIDTTNEYPESIRHSEAAKSLYDNLKISIQGIADDVLADLVCAIDSIFRTKSKKPDWQLNTDVKNFIDQEVEDLLWNIEKTHNLHFNYDKIIAEVRSIGIHNYAS